MKTGTKVLIGVGSAMLIGGGVFAYMKLSKPKDTRTETDKQFISGINGWLTYQKNNNWKVVSEGNDARVKAATYEMLRVGGKASLDTTKASKYNLSSWQEAYDYALGFMDYYKF